MCFQMADACDIQSHSNFRRQGMFKAGIYFQMARENIAYYFWVGNVALFDSHRDAITAFPGSSVSDWTVALNTWNTTREDTAEKDLKYQTPSLHVKGKQT